MSSSDTQKIDAAADFATSIYRSGDAAEIALRNGISQEAAVLDIAADTVLQSQNRGVLEPSLRMKLEAMTQEYAQILARIDRISADANQRSLPAIDAEPPFITKYSDET